MEEEIIVCSAIKANGKVWNGHRHNHCISAMKDELSWTMNRQEIDKLEQIQGFTTSLNRFVDRKEAMIIALKAEQVKKENVNSPSLYSEDLY